MEARSFRFAAAALLIAARAGMAYAADAVAPAGSAPPAAYTVAPSGPDMVTLNFVNADIEGVVKAVGEITGKNFVIDPRVKGTINIISSQPMSRALVYEVFLAALRLQGFAAVEDRGLVKILPEADAKLHRGSAQRGVGDEIQTRIFNLKYESAAQMVTILRPLISPNNSITPAQSSNSLIITDYAGNLERIARIIGGLDRPTGTDPIDIPLHNASALDVAATINRLFAEAGAPAAAEPALHFVIIPDARSNSILVRSADPSRLAQIRQLADMLDSRTSAGGNIHVVYLKNAEAVKIAETLRAIYSGEGGALRPVQSAPLPALGASAMAAAAPVPGQSTQGMGAQAALPAQPAAAGVGTPGIIQADAATNSIIITAPDAVYNNLRAALEKLDVRRAQVYVEAMIAEITSDKAAEFGIQWQDLNGTGGTTASAFGGTNFGTTGQNILGIAANPTTAGAGLNVGIIKGTVSIGGVQLLNLGVLVRALESNNNANILSTPTLLTLDNEEARIVIGQNVPFITGQYAISGAATTPTPFQTIERRDVGLTLRIKPQVSEGGAVRLQIYQEVSSIADSTNPAGVITNMRSVASTVMVDDGQIVVIGHAAGTGAVGQLAEESSTPPRAGRGQRGVDHPLSAWSRGLPGEGDAFGNDE